VVRAAGLEPAGPGL